LHFSFCYPIFHSIYLGHGGYGACHKCDTSGDFIKENKMMCYARLRRDDEENKTQRPATNRTAEDFRARRDGKHHKKKEPIQLERLANCNIVDVFTVDVMHCFCRGAMIRFFHVFNWNARLGNQPAIIQE
jgi:hypothetical protein